MSDLLVSLYSLPPRSNGEGRLPGQSIAVRRANSFELTRTCEFIRAHFSQSWADEMAATFARQPITGFLAIDDGRIVGFAAYESTRRAFFGPTGVDTQYRGRGIGKALLIAALWGLHDLGYAYGIIGAAGPTEFYQKTVGAIVIPNSTPGVYTDMLRKDGIKWLWNAQAAAGESAQMGIDLFITFQKIKMPAVFQQHQLSPR